MQEKITTYVHESKEVVLTGRIASPSNTRNKTIMVEIVPVGADADDKDLVKWVKMEDLYIVQSIEDEDFE